MIQRRYLPSVSEPPHRKPINVTIQPSGAIETAVYNADEKSFYIRFGGGWLDIGTHPIASWSQKPPRPRLNGMSADEIEDSQRLPSWLGLDSAGRRARRKLSPWAACWTTGRCSRCDGACPHSGKK